LLCKFNSLCRYASGTKSGHQAALPALAMQALRDDFGVRHECFASPLNAETSSFCSLFPDTDRFFGSSGSFFDFFPKMGSFECNPFDYSSVERTLEHIVELLLSVGRCKLHSVDK
jgi:phosphorylated CTD-interacting factor 1